ncbi:MAG TPA: sensor histidine kinase, partial [Solirubrobacteraceae bacterium]|nr:sensor histidine kinase [Solirubrobacteraceae bacterium]
IRDPVLELHDETLQSLSALKIGLSTAERAAQPEQLARAVRATIEQLEDGIANLRALITDLRPAALDELGVKAAIEALAERSARRQIEVDVDVELAHELGLAATRLSPELETALYRIVQEALGNAAKHGHASRAVVEIREEPTVVRLSVRDDGDGFDPTAGTNGFGLLGIRERVDLHGGELSIDSAPGRGAEVKASLPVIRREEPPASSAAHTLTG